MQGTERDRVAAWTAALDHWLGRTAAPPGGWPEEAEKELELLLQHARIVMAYPLPEDLPSALSPEIGGHAR